jgi:hypothetical protein
VKTRTVNSADVLDAIPVVYALGSDGRLVGLWEAGRGEEILTPER